MPARARREFALDYVNFLMMAKKAEQMGLDKGADDFLVKPFDKLELFSRVRNLIRVKTLMQDKIENERRLEMEKERRGIMRDVIYAVSGGKLVLAEENELEHNFRRILKARCMHLGTPLQLVREKTILLIKQVGDQQDPATPL